MNDMKHLDERWSYIEQGRTVVIITEDQWTISKVHGFLPDDESGISTARYICDLHNAALDAKQANQNDNAPPKDYRLVTDEERKFWPYPEDCKVMFTSADMMLPWKKSRGFAAWTGPNGLVFAVPEGYQFIDRSDEADAKRKQWLIDGPLTDEARIEIDAGIAEDEVTMIMSHHARSAKLSMRSRIKMLYKNLDLTHARACRGLELHE